MANIIALDELIDGLNITDVANRFVFETIKLEAASLKNLDIIASGGMDAKNTRKVSSVRLLDNISALGELSEMRTTSEAGRRFLSEVIKLEIKTFKDLYLNEFSQKTPCEQSMTLDATANKLTNSNSDSDSNPSSESTLSFSKPLVLRKEKKDDGTKLQNGVCFRSKMPPCKAKTKLNAAVNTKPTDLNSNPASETINSSSSPALGNESKARPMKRHNRGLSLEKDGTILHNCVCFGSKKPPCKEKTKLDAAVTTKLTIDLNSNFAPGTVVSSSSPGSGIESKTRSTKERNRVRSFPFLPRLFPPRASRKEWLRSAQGPLQDNDMMENVTMEMVFYLTSKNGRLFTTSND